MSTYYLNLGLGICIWRDKGNNTTYKSYNK